MNRRNLVLGALATVASVALIAWVGEITGRYHVIPRRPAPALPPMPPLPPVQAEPVERADSDDAKRVSPVAAPSQPDPPKPEPAIDRFTQAAEPIQMPVKFTDTTVIPPNRGIPDTAIEILSLSQLDKAPILIYQARPDYPYSLRQQGVTGDVLVDFVVDTNGKVRNVSAVRSSQREFEDAACAAVAKWKFKPGWKNGRAVFTRMEVPIIFTLDQGP